MSQCVFYEVLIFQVAKGATGKGGAEATGGEERVKERVAGESAPAAECQYALLEFEKPVTCLPDAIAIGSRLDTDVHSNVCRIAFHGSLVHAIVERDYASSVLPRLRVFKLKFREGVVERVILLPL